MGVLNPGLWPSIRHPCQLHQPSSAEYFSLLLSLGANDAANILVTIDLVVDGRTIRALVDSGATASFIRQSLAADWGWACQKAKGIIKLCGEGEATEFQRIGSTKGVKVS